MKESLLVADFVRNFRSSVVDEVYNALWNDARLDLKKDQWILEAIAKMSNSE